MSSRQTGLIAWFARNHVAANLLMCLIIAFGIVSSFTIRKQTTPDFELNNVQIRVPNSEIFGQILNFVKAHSRQCKMRESAGKAMLVIENITSVDAAIDLLHHMSHQTSRPASEILSK